jgi:ABC-2 type transport system permease protein
VDDLRLYVRLVRGRARSQLQYPLGFVSDAVATLVVSLTDLIAVVVLFTNVPAMAGWSALQVGFLYGVAQSSFAIADAIFGHLDRLPETLRSGSFDGVLLKPRSTLLLSLAADFALRRVGQLLQALVVLVVSWWRLGIGVGPEEIAMVLVTVAAGVGIFGGIWVIGASTTFWTVDTFELTNSFTYGGRQLTSYPMGVYGTWLRRFVTFAVPLACVAYFPVRHLVGLEPPGTPVLVRFAGIPAAVALWVVARIVWGAAVRTYRGTGS